METVLIITDAYPPQVNGVVTTLLNIAKALKKFGYNVKFITPQDFATAPLPSYNEIKIACNPWKVGRLIEQAEPTYIHVATEGPIGLFATQYCRRKKYRYTTSYHTKMPEYMKMRYSWVPECLTRKYMKHIHKGSSSILVTTPTMQRELTDMGFTQNMEVWWRGVDTDIFRPYDYKLISGRKLALYVGRVSVEKNIGAFIEASHELGLATMVVGDGPERERLEEKYPDTFFVGTRKGAELANYYNAADVFVFPSKTDTFGIVMLEAMACGTPVAAYNVTGPIDCVDNGITGYVDSDLKTAIRKSLLLNRDTVAMYGSGNTWESCAITFMSAMKKRS